MDVFFSRKWSRGNFHFNCSSHNSGKTQWEDPRKIQKAVSTPKLNHISNDADADNGRLLYFLVDADADNGRLLYFLYRLIWNLLAIALFQCIHFLNRASEFDLCSFC